MTPHEAIGAQWVTATLSGSFIMKLIDSANGILYANTISLSQYSYRTCFETGNDPQYIKPPKKTHYSKNDILTK